MSDIPPQTEPAPSETADAEARLNQVLFEIKAQAAVVAAAAHAQAARRRGLSTQALLAMIVILMLPALLWVLATDTIPAGNEPAFNIAMGALLSAATAVIAFYFGSTKGARDRDDRREQLVQAQADAAYIEQGGQAAGRGGA